MALFDTSSCFPDKDKLQIKLTLPVAKYNLDKSVIGYQHDLEERIVEKLAEAVQEVSLRFTRPVLSFDSNGDLNAYLTILPRPPVMEMFTNAFEDIFLSTQAIEIYRNLTTIEECATLCIENRYCLSFDWLKTNPNLNPGPLSNH